MCWARRSACALRLDELHLQLQHVEQIDLTDVEADPRQAQRLGVAAHGSRTRTSRSTRTTSATRRCGASAMAAMPGGLSAGLLPDAAVVHQADLAPDDLLPVLGMLHRRPLEIEVLGVDRLLVEQLVELGAQVLHPVVPLGAGPMVAQGLDVDDTAD